MAQLTSRLVISLVDRVSGPARGIAGSLKSLHAAGARTSFVAMGREARAAGQHFTALGTRAAAAGMGLYGMLQQTKEFNESNFGYGFAKLTEHMKGGKLDLKGWNTEMKRAGDGARKVAKEYGLVSSDVMRAREQVEKLGLKNDNTSESIFRAALGLHATEPDALATDIASSYMGAMYRAYEKQRNELAAKLGKSAEDKDFNDAWIKGIAAKTAVAGAESALGPGDVVEGLRQYAPQWASMNIPPEFAMAMLAHGSNYGFRASELGTAFKSMGNRLVKPTKGALDWFNTLGIDRSQFMGTSAQSPAKATTALSSLLGGGIKPKQKAEIRRVLEQAQRDGNATSPEFQMALTNRVKKMMGRNSALDDEQIQTAVANATLTSNGEVDIRKALKLLKDKGATPAALMEIFEGKHYARNSPVFQFYDQMLALFDKLEKTDGSVIDAAIVGRKQSYAGTLSQLADAWQEFFLTLQDTGVIEGIKTGLIGFGEVLRSLNPEYVKMGTQVGASLIALAMLAPALRLVASGARIAFLALKGIAALLGFGGAAAAATAATPFGLGAGKIGGAAAKLASGRMVSGMGAGGQMISGMSAAGHAAAQGKNAAFFAGSRLGGTAGKVLGRLAWPLTIAGEGYNAYDKASQTGNWADGAKSIMANHPLYLAYRWWKSGGTAAALEAGGMPSSTAVGVGGAVDSQIQSQTVAPAQQAGAEIKSIIGAIDLTAEGSQIMQSLANGMMGSLGAVRQAAQAAANEAARSATRGAFTDGGMR